MRIKIMLATIGFATAATPCIYASEAQRPNIIYILVDDLGYADIEPFGSKVNETPNLNKMADEGICFTSCYATPLSSPSRAAIMSGCYPKRIGLATGSWFITLMNQDAYGLNPDEFILPEVLNSKGYTTGCFGKWHLGDQFEFLPCQQGFDEFYGLPYSNDLWPSHPGSINWKYKPEDLPIMRGNKVDKVITTMQEQGELCNLITTEAVDWIKKNHNTPFFAYIPHAFIHTPRNARDKFYSSPIPYDHKRLASEPSYYAKERIYASVKEVDWSVGKIMQILKELGIDDNTLVIFTSDNGGTKESSNAPLRGYKGSTYEGGIRVPAIFWWKGHFVEGAYSDEIITLMDIMPTIADIVDCPLPKEPSKKIDGHSILPLLEGDKRAKSPWDVFLYHRRGILEAVRCGDWKLFDKGELYNLKNDVEEKYNVASKNPEIVKRLRGELIKAHADLDDPINCRLPGINKDPQPLILK